MKNTNDNQNAYHGFARFYDEHMSQKKYEVWRKLIKEVVAKYHIGVGNAFDVACGTGTITGILADLGFTVTGIDRSGEMLEVAKQRFPDQTFICSDVRDFSVDRPKEQSFAVSFYDSLNYLLTDADMLMTFESVSRNLASSAIFLFDMNTREHVVSSQKNSVKVYEGDYYYSIFKFGGEDRIWTLDIDLFALEPDGHYSLCRENHVERGYNREDIEPLLEKAGFKLLDYQVERKVYEDGLDQPSRQYFTAQKV